MIRNVIHRLPIGWAGRLALQRLLSQWRSLLTIIAGTLLGASVGALVPLYTNAVAQVSMVEKFNQSPAQDVNGIATLSLVASNITKLNADQPSQPKDFASTVNGYDSQFRALTDKYIGNVFPGWLDKVVLYGETTSLAVDPPAATSSDATTPDPTSQVFVAYYQDWQQVLLVVNGRLPNDTPADTNADIEIAVPLEAQNVLGVKVGDLLTLDQGGPTGGWPTSKNVRALVVGVVNAPEPLSAKLRPYFMAPSPIRVNPLGGTIKAEYPVLTTQAAFQRVATDFVPDTPTHIGWRMLFDHTRLPFPRSAEARDALFKFDEDVKATFARGDKNPLLESFNYSTNLINWQQKRGEMVDMGIMLAYEGSVKTLDAPFGLLLLQVGALVIFFLLVTAALVRRGERREIAMLQSRGAMDTQIVVIRGIEALFICAIAAIAAPTVSQQLLIAITPFFARYSELPLLLTPTTYVYSIIAASIAFLALVFTLRPVLRLPLITSGGATLRSDQQPWWQRYYVDVVLVVIGLAALWRLVGNNTPLFTTTTGGRTTDPFLLLAPAFLFLGLGSILLRLFPAIAGFTARLLAAGRGLVGPMATWQLSREPIHYGRITFLLALAIGIGWFATSFRATVNRSQNDQAQYKVGTDIRFDERDLQLNAARALPDSAYTQIPGVAAATVAWRLPNVNFQADPAKSAVLGDLLAVDSDTFLQTLYWRPDLGAVNLPRQPGQPIPLPERGKELPFVPQKFNLWALFNVPAGLGRYLPDLDRLRNRVTIYIRLLDATGTWIRVPFKITETEYVPTDPQTPGAGGGGAFVTDGWAYLEADLTALAYKPVAPVRLVSIYWDHRGRVASGEADIQLILAGFKATDPTGVQQSLPYFSSEDWEFAYDSGAKSDGKTNKAFIDARRGNGIITQWSQNAQSATDGLLLNYPDIGTIPMIGSHSLVSQFSIQSGGQLKLHRLAGADVTFQVIDQQRYYPTLYDAFVQNGRWTTDDRSHPYAIVDRDSLLYLLNRLPSAAIYADEVWLKTTPGANVDSILAAMRPSSPNATSTTAIINVQTLPGELSNLQTDPLSLGLLGLMFLAFIIAMALSIVGLLTYATLTAAARRSEFGVMRALGMSSARLVGQLAFEQIFVVALGAILGGLLGAVLSNQVVPQLAQDTTSKTITPPFIVQVESAALTQYGLIILAVLGLVLLFSLILVSQLSLTRTLRLGDE